LSPFFTKQFQPFIAFPTHGGAEEASRWACRAAARSASRVRPTACIAAYYANHNVGYQPGAELREMANSSSLVLDLARPSSLQQLLLLLSRAPPPHAPFCAQSTSMGLHHPHGHALRLGFYTMSRLAMLPQLPKTQRTESTTQDRRARRAANRRHRLNRALYPRTKTGRLSKKRNSQHGRLSQRE
jgi:hypothetical protein